MILLVAVLALFVEDSPHPRLTDQVSALLGIHSIEEYVRARGRPVAIHISQCSRDRDEKLKLGLIFAGGICASFRRCGRRPGIASDT